MCDKIDISTLARFRLPGVAGVVLRKLRDDVWGLCGEGVPQSDLCKNCHHVVARHEYTFSIMDEFQEYTMLCLLCGKAEDTISILPDDPRQMTLLF